MSESKHPNGLKLKPLSDDPAAKSNILTEVPHFFWFLDTETEECAYFANLGDRDAAQIVEDPGQTIRWRDSRSRDRSDARTG